MNTCLEDSQMKQVKIAIIGAGSGIFSINLIKDL